MKHYYRKILSMCLFVLTSITVSAYDCEIDGILYELSDNEATVVCPDVLSYDEANYSVVLSHYYSGDLVIPSSITYEGVVYNVTAIGYSAFMYSPNLTSVTIPNSITSIANGAIFQGCDNLESIKVSSDNPVYDSRENCNAIIETSTNTLIAGCKNTVIPNTVTAIGGGAFYDCYGLTSITIPNKVTDIGSQAFSGCIGLINISVDSGNTKYDSRDNCNAIIETESNTLISGCQNTIIPNSVTGISGWAFEHCVNIASINIPNSVTAIGSYAFDNCTNLSSITIGNGLTQITYDAFRHCKSLESIKVASDNPTYDSRDNCNAIVNTETNQIVVGCKTTTFPNSVTGISEGAFYGCNGLNSIYIGGGVKTIGRMAFAYCTELTSLTISSNVISVQRIAFSFCPKLAQIIVEDGNSKYDSRDNCNAIIEKADNTLALGCKNTVIPSSVKSIGKDAFAGCSEMTTIDIPNQITVINSEAFYDCTNLKSVHLPENLKSIGKHSFQSCTSLTDITIPKNVVEILDQAFSDCYNLRSIISKIEEPSDILTNVFSIASYLGYPEIYSNAILYVPIGTIDKYKACTGWKEFLNITDTEPSGVKSVMQRTDVTMKDIYSLDGKLISQPKQGLNIIKMNDGTTKKVVVK